MHLILTSLIIIDVAHGLKKNYATNNHSSLVCTETEKKKKEKKNGRQSTIKLFRDCYQEENICPIPECKG